MASYQQSLKVQEQLAQNRIRFSTRLNEMCDELLGLAREGERMRKMVSLCRTQKPKEWKFMLV